MVVEEVATLISQVGNVVLWLKAVGLLLILYITVEAITFYLNIRRYRELLKIKDDMVRIEKKIDALKKK